jgi:hypothetical protein
MQARVILLERVDILGEGFYCLDILGGFVSCFKCVTPDVTRTCPVCLDMFSLKDTVIAHTGLGIKHPIHLECFQALGNKFSECLCCKVPLDLKSVKAKRLKIPIPQEIQALKKGLIKETKLSYSEVNHIIENQSRYTQLHQDSDLLFNYIFLPAFAVGVVIVTILPSKDLWVMIAVELIFALGVIVCEPYLDRNYRSYRRHEGAIVKVSQAIEGWKTLLI